MEVSSLGNVVGITVGVVGDSDETLEVAVVEVDVELVEVEDVLDVEVVAVEHT